MSTEELPIKINLIAPPLYVMTTSTPERNDGLKALENAIEKIRATIEKLGGIFNVQMPVISFKSISLILITYFTLSFSFFFYFLAESCHSYR